MTTTTLTITDEQIEQLRREAAAAGDTEQVRLCRVALGAGLLPTWTRDAARAECARVIADAQAMQD